MCRREHCYDPNVVSHRFIRPCEIKSCISCSPDYTKCFGCKERFTLTEFSGMYTCTPVDEKSESFPIPDSMIRRIPTENKVGLSFPPAQSRSITRIEALDLVAGKTYPCADIGCKFEFKNDLLELNFDSQVQITQGQLNIYRGTIKSSRLLSEGVSSGHRLLQSDESLIVVKNFVLMKTNWYYAWTTVFQVIFFVYRFAGSIALFPRYPHLAMICDRMINLSFVISLLMGQMIPISDFGLHVMSSIKLPWYRLDNPFRNWSPSTLMCQTRPKYAEQGMLCSFLDNYGHDLLGFIGLTTLFAVIGWASKRYLSRAQEGYSKCKDAVILLEKYFDMRYIIAKLDANHMIIMSTVLISFDLDDSSSKSVVGRGIALVLFAGFLAFVYATVRRSSEKFQIADAIKPTTRLIAYTETETDLLYARPKSQLPSAETTTPFWWSKVGLISFVDQNCNNPQAFWQAFPVLMKYLRTISICILTLNFLEDPLTQTILVLLVQTAFTTYLLLSRVYRQRLEFYSVLSVEVIYVFFILLKAVSTSTRISKHSKENVIGALLGLLIAVAVLSCLVFQTLAIFVFREDPSSRQGKQSTPRSHDVLQVRSRDAPDQSSPALPVQQPVLANPGILPGVHEEVDSPKAAFDEMRLEFNVSISQSRSEIRNDLNKANATSGVQLNRKSNLHPGLVSMQGFVGTLDIPGEFTPRE